MQSWQRVFGSAASRDGSAVLVIGPPHSGKSDLVLRLLGRGFSLVADDQVDVADDGMLAPPQALAGLLEVRGLGIMRLPHESQARLALVVLLNEPAERLPAPEIHPGFGVPVVRLADARQASAPDRVILALACALGQTGQLVGAFAA